MEIAILIPCYNEELTIGKVVSDFRKELPDSKIYVYDNNSDDNTILAMASLASGRLNPEEAYEYLSMVGIKNVVVGMSSKEHAVETINAINKYL